MNTSKTHQEQNTILAKTVNELKIELRRSKYEVHLLRNQLQSTLEQNIQMAEQRTNLFNLIEQFQFNLDQVFANNSFSYVALSTSIQQIAAQNPKRKINLTQSSDGLNQNINESVCTALSIANVHGKPHQSARHLDHDDLLNTAFLDDTVCGSDESVSIPVKSLNSKIDNRHGQKLMKMQSRIPVPYTRSNNYKQCIEKCLNITFDQPKCRRFTKRINYREPPINRKMRQSH